jgi:hypothetical protein
MNRIQIAELKFIKKSMGDALREVARNYKCKKYSDCVYKKMHPYLLVASFRALYSGSTCELRIRTTIKMYEYDDIFWDMFDMSENATQPDSLRVMGAFVSPAITICNNTIAIADKFEVARICEDGIKEFLDKGQKYISQIESQYGNFDNYILQTNHDVLLKILAYIHLGNYDEAQNMAKDELRQGRTGAFQNKGIWINEYIVQYCAKK